MFKIFLPLLTVLFVGLKLTGFIVWNWFWVVSPIALPVLICICFLLLTGSLWLLIEIFDRVTLGKRGYKEEKRKRNEAHELSNSFNNLLDKLR